MLEKRGDSTAMRSMNRQQQLTVIFQQVVHIKKRCVMKQKRSLLLFLIVSTCLIASPKKAIIFGVTGQDGSYLAEFLLEQNYEVHGIRRRTSSSNMQRLSHLTKNERFFIHHGDVSDISNIAFLIKEINPDEIYNLAAQSNVQVSFDTAEYTANINALGTLRILEAILKSGNAKAIRFYQASSSEMFGKAQEGPQSEQSHFHPRSPYGVAKLYAHWITKNYRESYNMFACSGILFNHESPLRGKNFVTRKITRAVAKIHLGEDKILSLGNMDVRRDWGYAKDYVKAMWLTLQQDAPDDYVIATGESHSVREFVEQAFQEVGISIQWEGTGVDEVGRNATTGKIIVAIDPKYFRPAEIATTHGDAAKAKRVLCWKNTTSFKELVAIMVHADIQNIQNKTDKKEVIQ